MTPTKKAADEEKPKTKLVWLLEFQGDVPSGDGTWWVCHACKGSQKHRLRRVRMNVDEPSDSTHINERRNRP